MFQYKHASSYIRRAVAPIVNNLRLLIQDNTNLTHSVKSDLSDEINRLKKKHDLDDDEIRELLKGLREDLDIKLESVREEITIIKESPQVPIGTILIWALSKIPEPATTGRWLECNGQSILQSKYPELYALVGGNVPDMRGLFLRGYGGNSSGIGQVQQDAGRNITGGAQLKDDRWSPTGAWWNCSGAFYCNGGGGRGRIRCTEGYAAECLMWFDASRVWGASHTANEFRPINMAVRYYIVAN